MSAGDNGGTAVERPRSRFFTIIAPHIHMKALHMVAWILLVVGGLNWLLVGVGGFAGSDWNVVAMIFGKWPQVEWLVYVLVGLSAIYELATHRKNCRVCGSGAAPMM